MLARSKGDGGLVVHRGWCGGARARRDRRWNGRPAAQPRDRPTPERGGDRRDDPRQPEPAQRLSAEQPHDRCVQALNSAALTALPEAPGSAVDQHELLGGQIALVEISEHLLGIDHC